MFVKGFVTPFGNALHIVMAYRAGILEHLALVELQKFAHVRPPVRQCQLLAPLGLVFYEGAQFPSSFKGDAFVALHGSWNAGASTGYKVVRVPFRDGRPAGGYENFATGFWSGADKPGTPAHVWGRPAGLAVANDGSLLIADDAGKVVWRVSYVGK